MHLMADVRPQTPTGQYVWPSLAADALKVPTAHIPTSKVALLPPPAFVLRAKSVDFAVTMPCPEDASTVLGVAFATTMPEHPQSDHGLGKPVNLRANMQRAGYSQSYGRGFALFPNLPRLLGSVAAGCKNCLSLP